MSYKVDINHIVDIICWVIIIPIAVVIRMLLPVTTRFGSVLFIGSMGRHGKHRKTKRNVSMKMRHRFGQISVATQPPVDLNSR